MLEYSTENIISEIALLIEKVQEEMSLEPSLLTPQKIEGTIVESDCVRTEVEYSANIALVNYIIINCINNSQVATIYMNNRCSKIEFWRLGKLSDEIECSPYVFHCILVWCIGMAKNSFSSLLGYHGLISFLWHEKRYQSSLVIQSLEAGLQLSIQLV